MERRNYVIFFRAAIWVCFAVHLYHQMTIMVVELSHPDDSVGSYNFAADDDVGTLVTIGSSGSTSSSSSEKTTANTTTSAAKEEEVVEDNIPQLYDEESVQRLAKKLARAFPKMSKEEWCRPGVLPAFQELGVVDGNYDLLPERMTTTMTMMGAEEENEDETDEAAADTGAGHRHNRRRRATIVRMPTEKDRSHPTNLQENTSNSTTRKHRLDDDTTRRTSLVVAGTETKKTTRGLQQNNNRYKNNRVRDDAVAAAAAAGNNKNTHQINRRMNHRNKPDRKHKNLRNKAAATGSASSTIHNRQDEGADGTRSSSSRANHYVGQRQRIHRRLGAKRGVKMMQQIPASVIAARTKDAKNRKMMANAAGGSSSSSHPAAAAATMMQHDAPGRNGHSGDTFPYNYTQGVLLTKVHKSASSTMSGIVIQILLRNKCGQGNFFHQAGEYYAHRNKSQSFLLAPIRDPASRAISFINYRHVSLKGMTPTDNHVLKILHKSPYMPLGTPLSHYSIAKGGSSLSYISMNPLPPNAMWNTTFPNHVMNASLVEQSVKNAIQKDYNFLVVVERMDESLVALALVMGIDVADVVAIANAKVAGSGYDAWKCKPLKKSVHNQGRIAEFLESETWRAMNYGDYLLHATANHSLDMTIASLGKRQFDTAFSRYLRLKALAQETCAPSVKMPCDEDGNIQEENDCVFRDFGCGYRCLYDLANNVTKG